MPPFVLTFLASRIGMTATVAVGAFLAGLVYAFAIIPQPDIPAIVRKDAYWNRQIATENAAHEQALAAALAAAEAEPPVPADMAERVRLCRASKACRDKDRGQ